MGSSSRLYATDGNRRIIRSLAAGHDLSPASVAELEDLLGVSSQAAAGSDLIEGGDAHTNCYMLLEGFACQYELLADGRRQIMSLLIPGDIIGFDSDPDGIAPYSVAALTALEISPIPQQVIVRLKQGTSELAAAIQRVEARDRLLRLQHLVSLGRRSAIERMAWFLLTTYQRLRRVGMTMEGATFKLPITQETISDVLGISTVHVNRVLRDLRERDLLEMHPDNRITVPDEWALAELAQIELDIDPDDCLPEPAWNLKRSFDAVA